MQVRAFERYFPLKESTLLDLGIKVTLNIAQHPLHHVTYSPAKF